MLVVQQERPRNLPWYLTAPMLFGDWGTSRFYVLGLAFYFSLHASFYYVLGVCALVAAVGWAYTIICRAYPDGGGVYSAARQLSPTLAVVGALLLFADYIITAALSALEAIHYFGVHDGAAWSVGGYQVLKVPLLAVGGVVLVGVINFIGTRNAGKFALVVALTTLALTVVLALFTIPHLGTGWQNIHRPTEGLGHQWLMLVNVVLALSGVEAVANMTGVMVPPVRKTSRRTIYPVLVEVVLFNLLFAVGMNALPDVGQRPAAQYDQEVRALKAAHPDWQTSAEFQAELLHLEAPTPRENQIKNAVLRVMAHDFVHPVFATVCGVVFGLLLLSAVNTAVGGMISIQYVMSRDQELPRWFGRLNLFGVPWIALVPAVGVPVLILCFVHDLESLADLYAIGVVGAIAINLGSCTLNRGLNLAAWERAALGGLAGVMIVIELTLAYEKPHALLFALSVLGAGLGLRAATRVFPSVLARVRRAAPAPEVEAYRGVELPWPTASQAVPALAAIGTPAEELDMSRPRVMIATRGHPRTLAFAADYARQMGATLFVVFVRQLRVAFETPGARPSIDEDPEGRSAMAAAHAACQAAGVPMVPIYAVSSDVAATILDFAATYSVSALLMGVSRRGAVLKALQGDTISAVANNLPAEIPLLIHA